MRDMYKFKLRHYQNLIEIEDSIWEASSQNDAINIIDKILKILQAVES
jgi:hypothetical protein